MATSGNQRGYTRSDLEVTIEIAHESFGRERLRSRDLSAGGVFVVHGSNPALPPKGTVLDIWILGDSGEQTRAIKAEIVRVEAGGFALRFLEDPFAALES